MEGASTDSIRVLAPKWSLAGDGQLLNILQGTHQKIISKCQDVNSRLEEMASALDDASINLQNVNNKFMALSNSQFIESRVYDDEEDLTAQNIPKKEPIQPPPVDELAILKSSLAILERAHETAEIMDDSDSDSDTEISVVLKPKDMYSQRPLPYIIGTQAWKTKWHAGLIVEDSDSDSTTSKQDVREIEQYSSTESDAEETPRAGPMDHTMSETSSSFTSEQPLENTPPQQKPSDIAAELARRLGGPVQVRAPSPEEYTPPPPAPAARKVNRPEGPATSTIFSDEPPPLDSYEPEETQSEDDDIFAEINKHKPYTQRNTVQNNLAEDLFRFDKPGVEQGDIFSDFAAEHVETKSSVKQKSTLFDEESEPELFDEQPAKKEVVQNNASIVKQEEASVKKPVGGISLFGSNKGAESIGAAILKRNQRKSSTSGDESGSDKVENRIIDKKPESVQKNIEKPVILAKSQSIDVTDNKSLPKKQKDIFDDLFAKSQKVAEKKPVQKIIKEPIKEPVKERKEVKDLFSDNIFDDIDDIFTSNVKIPPKQSNQKSIFDDDDDDLFSDIAKPKPNVNQATRSKDSEKTSNNKKSIFDSDDDIFNDVKTTETDKTISKIESQKLKPEEITSNENYNREITKVENTVKSNETRKERNLFDDSPQNVPKPETKPQVKSKGIFDSDSEEDIFASIKTKDNKKLNKTENVLNSNTNYTKLDSEDLSKPDISPKLLTVANEMSKEKTTVIQSPSLFEEDEIDDLFINANKLNNALNEPKEITAAEVKTVPSIATDTDIIKDASIANNNLSDTNNSFYETEQNVTEKPTTISQNIADRADLFDDNLLKDDIFSNSNESSRDISSQSVSKEIVPDIVDSNQKVEDSIIEETNGVSKEETEAQYKDTHVGVITTEVDIETNNPDHDYSNQSVFDDFIEPVEERNVFATGNMKPISKETNVFDDIFTEPPAFEKLAEPKKSQNVNALFDDDSDDESLFFKKDDVISDEKPEIFSSNANFDIFVDEPPAIDVDFTPKSAKTTDLNNDDMFSFVPETRDLDGDLFSSKMKESVPDDVIPEIKAADTNVNTPNITTITNEITEIKPDITNISRTKDVNKDLFSAPEVDNYTKIDTTTSEENKINKLGKGVGDSDEDIFSSLPKPDVPKSSQKDYFTEQNKTLKSNVIESPKTQDEFDDIFKSKESPKKESETKKIGKLDTKKFNINVNALIPGASPKKVPKERKDEQNIDQESESEPKVVKIFPTGDETDDVQPKQPRTKFENVDAEQIKDDIEPKSIDFEEKPESDVLDNNLSKQRARIQVKRRPSSRRARHEAVRKSGIDFGDDTDNSSSLDEPVKHRNISNDNKQSVKTKQKEHVQDTSYDTHKEVASPVKTVIETRAYDNIDSNVVSANSERDNKDTQSKEAVKGEDSKQNVKEQKGRTTKVVYILNDEDIFNTGPKSMDKELDKKYETQVDDLFGTKRNETKLKDDIFKSTEGIKTLGNTYKEHTMESAQNIKNNVNTNKTAEDMSKKDDNIITKDVKSSRKPKTSLFDDSDDELFNKNKKKTNKVTIFDSDSEEDLFSGKKKKEKQNKEQRNKEVKERIEVNVKGSLFGDEDDDDDLFGVKKEKLEPKIQASKPSTSKETPASISRPTEPVFDDPLSLLGDDD